MSQLQKKIQKIQRREGPAMGFGFTAREQPRAMLLAAYATDANAGRAAIEAGVDVVLLRVPDATEATSTLEALSADKATVGVQVTSLTEGEAEALAKAGCDFVISTLEGTDSSAVDTERMGQVVVAAEAFEDNTLRSLGPLGLDAIFVERPAGAMKLGEQLGLVRLSSFASSPLIVTIDPNATVSDLRVLRDSGVAVVTAPAGTGADQLKAIGDNLKAVPAPRKARKEGADIAMVPAMGRAVEHAHEEDGDDDDDD